MRSFYFSIELWRSRFDIDVSHTIILNMPMKLGLKLMASVCPNRMDAEREFLNHIINELYGILLIVARIDLQRSDPGSIINGCILKTSDSVAVKVPQRNKFNIHLDVMAGNFFCITSSVNSSTGRTLR